jgi:hypothetical protein
MLSVRVHISGNRPSGHAFSAEVSTVVVNAHGALIVAVEELHVGQLIVLKHLRSGEEQMSRVIQIEPAEAGKGAVALEFLEPAPRFWRISFPPLDWSTNSPEAKQITARPAAIVKARSALSHKFAPLPTGKKMPWR